MSSFLADQANKPG
ncbi:hypothetical protein (Partial), partial [Seminavis robusta]